MSRGEPSKFWDFGAKGQYVLGVPRPPARPPSAMSSAQMLSETHLTGAETGLREAKGCTRKDSHHLSPFSDAVTVSQTGDFIKKFIQFVVLEAREPKNMERAFA